MNSFVKRFGIIAFVTIVGLFIVGCEMNIANDYELLNGDWDTGEYVFTFNDGNGVFKEFHSSFWVTANNAGRINIGDQVYRKFVKTSDKKWTGEIRIYNSNNPYETLRWEDCTITLNENSQTIQIVCATGAFNNCRRK